MGDREAVNRFAVPGTFPAIGKPAAVGSSEKSSTWMKRTVHFAGKMEPFFGTLDENVRLLEESPRGMFDHGKSRSFGKKALVPRNAAQRHYMEQIEHHDMMFGIGPAGTGKTYIAV